MKRHQQLLKTTWKQRGTDGGAGGGTCATKNAKTAGQRPWNANFAVDML